MTSSPSFAIPSRAEPSEVSPTRTSVHTPEKRLLPRHLRRLRVALGRHVVFTADLSPGGFCAELLHPLDPGQPVSGSISLAAKDFPFTGEVVWSRPAHPRMRALGRIGVRFTSIENRFFTAYCAEFEAPALTFR